MVGEPVHSDVEVPRIGSAELVQAHEIRFTATRPWQLQRKLTYVCRSLDVAPAARYLGIEADGLRLYTRLDEESGARAAALLASAGTAWE